MPRRTPLWQDQGKRLALGSFTAFVGVALNDQTVPGCGQLCVVKGVHEHTEAFFRMQRAAGGVVGIEGPGWPRFKRGGGEGGEGVFLNCTCGLVGACMRALLCLRGTRYVLRDE